MKSFYKGKLKLITACIIMLPGFSSLASQEKYIGFGAGLHFDLASLGESTSVDGVNSIVGVPTLQGHSVSGGCPDVQCQREIPGYFQEIVVPDNKLKALEKSTAGIFKTEAKGPMTGLVLSGFYEYVKGSFFFRGGIDYTVKIMGGYTSSSIIGFQWYESKWDYKSLFIPLYVGFKAKMNHSSVYAGGGINYFSGGWNLEGTNLGDIPTYGLGLGLGLSTVYDAGGNVKGGSVYKEHLKFNKKGMGFNAVIGIEINLKSGNKTFFEIDHKIAGGQATDRMESTAGISAVAPFAVYPQNLSGTIFKFGYKYSLTK
ncbi:MAG: porin OmpL1 [Spirochaetia bacterium]|nr:porin OmpL1 [Spirochaetia bacterium]